MADDQALDGGTGTNPYTSAADDVAGVKYQRVKIRVGVDGNAGLDVSTTDPMPVVQTGTPGLPTGAATSANQTSEIAALGAVGDAAYVSGSGSLVALLKGLFAKLPALVSGRVPVDGSGVTQPVSGTFWQATQPVSGTVTTTPPANASTNLAQVAGTTPDTNSGNKSAGTLRVTLATDQVALTNALKVDPSAVTSPVSLATNTPVETRATTGAAPTAFTSTTSAQIFASNAARKLFTVYNNSDKDLYLMLASAAASATSFHTIVKAGGGFFSTSDYSGEIRGIMAATIGTGQVNPGEFT